MHHLSLPLLACLLSCSTSAPAPVDRVPEGGEEGAGEGGGDEGSGEDTAEEEEPWSDEEIESVPGALGPDDLFVNDAIHALHLELSVEALDALRAVPKEYVEALLTTEEGTFKVAVRLKGNTSYDSIDGKPAIKVDINHFVEGQTLWGQPSFYLQNMIWDPSDLHEFMSYSFFQDAGVVASRAAYATLGINDWDYGLYLVLEKQNSAFMRARFDDDTGSIYESGSFNWPCDLTTGLGEETCTCFEVDRVGDADSFTDLQDLCEAARLPGPLDEVLAGELDMDLWRRSVAAEMMVSHYDNYSWNLNNFRIAHLPSTGMWVFTPWSADLSWGWYPWVGSPHCGMYGRIPSEYQGGMLMDRCWMQEGCTEALRAELLDLADLFEQVDMVARLEATYELIKSEALAETRGYYGPEQFEAEVQCMRELVPARPTMIRDWLDATD